MNVLSSFKKTFYMPLQESLFIACVLQSHFILSIIRKKICGIKEDEKRWKNPSAPRPFSFFPLFLSSFFLSFCHNQIEMDRFAFFMSLFILVAVVCTFLPFFLPTQEALFSIQCHRRVSLPPLSLFASISKYRELQIISNIETEKLSGEFQSHVRTLQLFDILTLSNSSIKTEMITCTIHMRICCVCPWYALHMLLFAEVQSIVSTLKCNHLPYLVVQ